MKESRIFEFREMVQERLRRKWQKAKTAWINARRSQVTENCIHAGRELSDRIRICKIGAMGKFEGNDGGGATTCWNEKCKQCSLFEAETVESVSGDFERMTEDELRVRWPSIGELVFVLKEIDNAIGKD